MIIGIDFSIWNTGLVIIKDKIVGSVLIQAAKKAEIIRKNENPFIRQVTYKKADFVSYGELVYDIMTSIMINLGIPEYLVFEGSAYGFVRKGLEEQFALKGIFEYTFKKFIPSVKILKITPMEARKQLFGKAKLTDKSEKQKQMVIKKFQKWLTPYSRPFFNVYNKKDREHIFDAAVVALAYIKKIRGWDFDAHSYF